jgi:hypothetical protein
LIKDFHEEFDTIPEAKKYDTSQARGSSLFCLGHAWGYGFEGQPCTATVSPLFNKWGMQAPDLPRHALWRIYKELTSICVRKTELLVYSLGMAGQVDLLMRNEDSTEYHILDYKFIKEPLERKSYYNRFTGKMMSRPFSRLMDTTTLLQHTA